MSPKLARCGSIGTAALCLLVLQFGCAPTATLTTTRPPELDVRGVSRMAVLDFTGPSDFALLARTTVISQLQATGLYRIVDATELQRAASGPLYDAQGRVNASVALQAAARMQLDAVLLGRISHRRDGVYDLGTATVQIGDPKVSIISEFELLDVRTGQLLAQGQTEATYQGELTQDRSSTNSEQKVLRSLVASSAAKVVAKIAPHQVPVDVELATAAFGPGAGSILAGNKFARAGQWEEAKQQWQAAVSEDADSDAALYNLGLAHEAVGDLPRARQMFEAAARVADKDRYRQAIARVEAAEREHQILLAQANRAASSPAARRFQ
jgi:tetratricopeptide (TPR) repeat protein